MKLLVLIKLGEVIKNRVSKSVCYNFDNLQFFLLIFLKLEVQFYHENIL